MLLMILGRSIFVTEDCSSSTIDATAVNSMLTNLNNEEYDAASRKADEILEKDKNNLYALNVKGSLAFYNQDYAKAAIFFKKALDANPKNEALISNLADTYIELKNFKNASELYDSIRKDSDKWNYSKGKLNLLEGSYKEADRFLSKVSNNYQRGSAQILNSAAHYSLYKETKDKLLKEENLRLATKSLKIACDQDPNYWNAILSKTKNEKRESYESVVNILTGLRAVAILKFPLEFQ
jgi:tetratricopeptide (TPR) repeat protein